VFPRSPPEVAAAWPRRAVFRFLLSAVHHFHPQFPDLLRAGLQFYPYLWNLLQITSLFSHYGFCRRRAAGLPRRAEKHRRGAAGCL